MAMAPIPIHLLGCKSLVVVGRGLIVAINVGRIYTIFYNCIWIICDSGSKHFCIV